MQTYYSVETSLAAELQRLILKNHYLYVAVEFDPAGNHPTSNPRLLAEQWCRVATGRGTAADLQKWEMVRLTLHTVLVDAVNDGEISVEEYEAGLHLVATATLQSARPVLFVIRNVVNVEAGDTHAGFEATEEEYLIRTLKPTGDFEVSDVDC